MDEMLSLCPSAASFRRLKATYERMAEWFILNFEDVSIFYVRFLDMVSKVDDGIMCFP